MKANEFAKVLKSGKLDSFYIFTGDKDRIKRCLATIKGYQQTKAGTMENLVRLYSNKNVFGGRRLIIYEGDDLDEQSLVSLQRKSTNLAIIIMKSIDKRKKIFKGLNIVEFNEAPASLMYKIIDSTLGVEYPKQVVDLIISKCSGDLGRIENEAHKLKYAPEITTDVVDNMIHSDIDNLAFKLTNALALKNRYEVIRLINELTPQDNPVGLITLIYNQFRNILIIQGYGNDSPKEISMKTGLNINMIYAIKGNIGRYSIEQLTAMIKQINTIDQQVKMGMIDGITGLNMLVLKLLDIGW